MSQSENRAALGKIVVIVVGVIALAVVVWQAANFFVTPQQRQFAEAQQTSDWVMATAKEAQGNLDSLPADKKQKFIDTVGDEQRARELVQLHGGGAAAGPATGN